MQRSPSFIILVSGTERRLLGATLASLGSQTYNTWRALIVGALGEQSALTAMERLAGFENKVSRSGEPLDTASLACDYVIPLLAGDELAPDALVNFAAAAMRNEGATILYGDHAEQVSAVGPAVPFFKPDWSPEFLIATNYIGRAAVSASAFRRAELPHHFDAQDLWSLFLAIAREPGIEAVHIERPLLKLVPLTEEAFDAAAHKAQLIVRRHLDALNVNAQPKLAPWARNARTVSFDLIFPDDGPSIAIVVPSRNNWRVLKRCLDSLRRTTYQNFRVTVVDNESTDPATLDYLRSLTENVIMIGSPETGFSYSFVNNRAVEQLDSDYVLFLNDDTEVIEPKWLSQLAGWLQIPAVASVGGRLLFPNNTVQHVGIVHGLNEETPLLPGLAYRCHADALMAPRGQDRTARNYAALTAACLLMRRAEFLAVGGFDEIRFAVAYNDCDLGFRLTQSGKRHVFEPNAILYHHEGVSRGKGPGNDALSEEISFIEKYRGWRDPYFNANLSPAAFGTQAEQRAILTSLSGSFRIGVCVVTHNLNYEGAPLVLLDIVRGLAARCAAEITVLSPSDGPLRSEYEALGCVVEVVHTWGVYTARSEEDVYSQLQPLVERIALSSADIVLANTILSHWAILAACRAKLPAIWLIHESEPPFAHLAVHGEHHARLGASAMQQASLNVFVSRATSYLYQDVPKRRAAEIVYNGFDRQALTEACGRFNREEERKRLGATSEHIVAILPGTVCERKAQIDLVRAIEQISPALRERLIFLIVGAREDEYNSRLRQAVADLPAGCQKNIHIIRETGEIVRYYLAADIMTFTSHFESFPRVIQEAMFFGLAIVTTPVFGISEQLVNEKTGLFYQPGDVGALALQIERVVSNRGLRDRLRRNAKISLRRFPDIEEMQEKYANMVQRIFSADRENFLMSSDDRVFLLDSSAPSWWETFIGR